MRERRRVNEEMSRLVNYQQLLDDGCAWGKYSTSYKRAVNGRSMPDVHVARFLVASKCYHGGMDK